MVKKILIGMSLLLVVGLLVGCSGTKQAAQENAMPEPIPAPNSNVGAIPEPIPYPNPMGWEGLPGPLPYPNPDVGNLPGPLPYPNPDVGNLPGPIPEPNPDEGADLPGPIP